MGLIEPFLVLTTLPSGGSTGEMDLPVLLPNDFCCIRYIDVRTVTLFKLFYLYTYLTLRLEMTPNDRKSLRIVIKLRFLVQSLTVLHIGLVRDYSPLVSCFSWLKTLSPHVAVASYGMPIR